MSAKLSAALGLAAAVVCCIALAGCGQSSSTPASQTDGVYRLPLTGNPATLDPALYTDVDSEGVAKRVFNGLLKLDANLKPSPDLAESYEISPDGLSYTFHLRKGVKFHNGREMTSEDVRYSFERILRKETMSQRAWVVDPIAGSEALKEGKADSLSGLETPDAYTVVLKLERPYAPVLSLWSLSNASVVPKEEVENWKDQFGRHPMGTGPFKFVSWSDNDEIVLARNDDYFGGRPALAELRFRIMKEPLVAYQEYQAGRLEHCSVPPGYLETVKSGPQKDELHSIATLSTYYVGFTMTRKPGGENVHLRRAMNYAVDRDFLCNKVLGGLHAPAHGILPPGLQIQDARLTGYAYDLARAKEEMALAGYGPDNLPPELTLDYNPANIGQQIAEALQEDFKRIGVKVTLNPMAMAALLAATNKGEPDTFRMGWVADFPDAQNFFDVFDSKFEGSAGNRCHYSNPEVDALLLQARGEVDAAKRAELFVQVEKRIEDDAPWVFVSHGQTHLLVKPYVKNFSLTPMDVGSSVNQVDFAKVAFQ